MRIAHLCLSCFYIDGYGYQENELVRQHVNDGHDVLVIASTETFGTDRTLTYVSPGRYLGTDGAPVVRLPYRKLGPHALSKKLRLHPGVHRLLDDFKPDVMLFHGLCGFELLTAARYRRAHPGVHLLVDSHEDRNNSARSFLAEYGLHRGYYGPILRASLPDIDKVLCISIETMDFVEQMYGVPRPMLEFFPLGGVIYADDEYLERRARGRRACDLDERTTLLLQSGKMDGAKRLLESLDAFARTPGEHLRFAVVGSLAHDIEERARAAIAADRRVSFLGWKSSEELKDLLCAADVYVQPGTQSATMQMSLCARCAVVLHDVPSHRPFFVDNGWLIADPSELTRVFAQIRDQPERLPTLSARSQRVAERLLDYRVLARRITDGPTPRVDVAAGR
ncbi:MAG: glycosyltransferase family 4 protein [Deltaproteobacteria bacterium]|nr:glycosyltransferase family 4 protein [Deltaproteobacteria bacterium]